MLHVLGDTLRSTTTLVESILIWKGHINPGSALLCRIIPHNIHLLLPPVTSPMIIITLIGEVDAWSSFIVEFLVILSAIDAVRDWTRSVYKYNFEKSSTLDKSEISFSQNSSSEMVENSLRSNTELELFD